jgi:hypothetical protein
VQILLSILQEDLMAMELLVYREAFGLNVSVERM